MTPTPVVRKVAPVCRACGGTQRLVLGDGPAVCRDCIHMAGRLGQATVRRSDDRTARDGLWR